MPQLISYIFQTIASFVVLMVVYMLLALTDYQGGIGGLIGLTFFQPIMGAIFSVLTILACTILGLPIRLSKSIRHWWVRRPFIPILLFVTAVVFIIIAFLPDQMQWGSYWEGDSEIPIRIPNLYFIATGWFTLAFALLHFYPLGAILAKGEQHKNSRR
ncbi:MAG: hypothetical protein R2800_02620 [Flavipsychrobacter sp.]